ncbi:MAG: homocysteine S-methyltransferase family protein [Lachnospiraceae bacterium]
MDRLEFKHLLQNKVLLLDGATGTNLQAAGMPLGVCPEQWILDNPQVILDLQKAYVKAGTNILYAPTFTGNRIKLAEFGLEQNLFEINQQLVKLSLEAAAGEALVAGDISMTGQQLYPIGDLDFEELVTIYKEQILAISQAGADLLVIETMMSLSECRAALIAAKETCDLPVMVSLTFEPSGKTLFGSDPVTSAIVLESLGADAVGINCSTGPKQMTEQVKMMCDAVGIPVFAKPNAGLPKLLEGRTVFDMQPQEFAAAAKDLVSAGASLIGGCCGTTPEHISQLYQLIQGEVPLKRIQEPKRYLTSERRTVELNLDGPLQIIGERINPTGKRFLQEELLEGNLDSVMDLAQEQEADGAAILDVNLGMNGIDEIALMKEAIYEIGSVTNLPLCFDSSDPKVLEAALRIYPGRALINSISLEPEKFQQLIPIASKYGAMFILLPLSGKGLPKTIEEKHEIIGEILAAAQDHGISREAIIVDGLVATVGANQAAAIECLETISYCRKELGLATVCGLSNISFGLPERNYINAAFLTLAIEKGLTLAIANPSQDLIKHTALASDLLMNKKGSSKRYIECMGSKRTADEKMVIHSEKSNDDQTMQEERIAACVLNGNKNTIRLELDTLLQKQVSASYLINRVLIPAISKVGELYDQQVYFLPQLIASANAMEYGISYLEPMIEKDSLTQPKATIVIATVEGDIHDIGKNLVALLLRNFGYRVIDLGKDVAAEKIVDTAVAEQAQVIALSALMTTTMVRMKEVVDLSKRLGKDFKIIIGGAAATPSYAEEIHADGFSKDAAECVKLVERLLKK